MPMAPRGIAPSPPFAGGVTVPPMDLDVFESERPLPATPENNLVRALLREIRRVQVTAAPPANVRPTVWAQSIDLSAQVVVPGVVGAYTSVIDFLVPKNYGARIEQYGVNVVTAGYTYDGTLLWGFQKNQQWLVNGLSDWGEQRGSMVFPRKVAITLQAQDRIRFLVRRALAPGGALTVQMGIRGWLWPLRNTDIGTQAVATSY